MGLSNLPSPKADYNLTAHGLEVLGLFTHGDDHKQIAAMLFLNPSTVRANLGSIYKKLHIYFKSLTAAKALQERRLPKKV